MNDEVVFLKTPAGEEAVRERERLVQRNLRTVLIVVDGTADVATLKRNVGDAAMVDSALAELQRLGLIATRLSSGDAPATTAASEEPAFVTDASEAATEASPVIRDNPSPESSSDTSTSRQAGPDGVIGNDAPGWWSRQNRRHSDADEEELYERAYGIEDHTQVAVTGGTPQHDTPKPRRRMKFNAWPIVAVGLAAAATLAVLRVVLYPYDEYRPAFEEGLSQMLDDPVTVGNMHVNFLPWPMIVLEKVRIGKTPYATIAAVRMSPDPVSLIDGTLQCGEVHLDEMRVTDAGLARISRWFKHDRLWDASVSRLLVERLAFDFGNGSVGNLRGSADIDPKNGLQRVILRSKEGDLHIEAKPSAGGVSLAISAINWPMPSKPFVLLPAFSASGQLSPGLLRLDGIDIRAFDGVLTGDATIAWGNGASAMVKLDFQNIVAGKLLDALGGPPLVDGLANGKLVVAAQAKAANQLADDLRLNGSFKVARGGLRNIDLAEALKSAGLRTGDTIRGGRTDFEEFAGTIAADNRTIRVTGVKLSSGMLGATGQAAITRQTGTISGAITVGLHASGLQRNATIAIGGKAASPELRVGR